MHLKIRKSVNFLTILLVMSLSWVAVSKAADLSGQEIAQKVYDRDVGQNAQAEYEMILVNKKKHKKNRVFTLTWGKFGDDALMLQKSRFEKPADIRNTTFLTIERSSDESLQYLYLPALGRSRRIVTSQKDGSYVNTDFSYEDMDRRTVDASAHTLLGMEVKNIPGWGDVECYKLESIPDNSKLKSQYQKVITWVHPKDYLAVQVDFFNKKGKKFKQYSILEVAKIAGYWTEVEVLMENLKRGSKTFIKMVPGTMVRNSAKIREKDFTKKSIEL